MGALAHRGHLRTRLPTRHASGRRCARPRRARCCVAIRGRSLHNPRTESPQKRAGTGGRVGSRSRGGAAHGKAAFGTSVSLKEAFRRCTMQIATSLSQGSDRFRSDFVQPLRTSSDPTPLRGQGGAWVGPTAGNGPPQHRASPRGGARCGDFQRRGTLLWRPHL